MIEPITSDHVVAEIAQQDDTEGENRALSEITDKDQTASHLENEEFEHHSSAKLGESLGGFMDEVGDYDKQLEDELATERKWRQQLQNEVFSLKRKLREVTAAANESERRNSELTASEMDLKSELRKAGSLLGSALKKGYLTCPAAEPSLRGRASVGNVVSNISSIYYTNQPAKRPRSGECQHQGYRVQPAQSVPYQNRGLPLVNIQRYNRQYEYSTGPDENDFKASNYSQDNCNSSNMATQCWNGHSSSNTNSCDDYQEFDEQYNY